MGGCTLTGALSVTTSVRGSATIVHGPAGCAHHNFSLLHATGLGNDRIPAPEIISSGMLETEIVFGGEEALDRAIQATAREDVSVIFVLSTCIAEAIGDDVGAVCRKRRGVSVIPVPTAGFLGGSFTDGVNNALLAIAGMAREPATKRDGFVNIIGEKNLEYEVDENFREVAGLLGLLGLSVNVRFIHCARPDEIARAGAASINILRDEGVGVVGDVFYRNYGTPSVTSFPAGLSGSVSFLEVAGKLSGRDPAPAISEELQRQEALLEEFSGLDGCTVRFASGSPDATVDPVVSEILARLGLDVAPDGILIPVPAAAPVGTGGVRRLLHRWRRAIHA